MRNQTPQTLAHHKEEIPGRIQAGVADRRKPREKLSQCTGPLEPKWTHLSYWCAILIAHQIVMAKHGGSCVHFSGISTCGRTSRETVSHPQCPPLPTLCKISLPIYVIVTNKLLQPLTTTWYDSLVLSISLLKI